MTGDHFEGQLSELFQAPPGHADTQRLKDAVLRRVEQEDRRRRFAVLGSALVGVTITSSIIAASGVMSSAQTLINYVWTSLPHVEADLNGPWAVLIVGLLFAGMFATRAARDF